MNATKSLASVLALALVLSSCGKAADTATTAPKKTDFLYETKKFSEFPKTAVVEKIGRVVGSSAVTVSSQGVGRIESVFVKEGASVKKGQVIARLSDTVANYGIRHEQAANGIDTVDANFDSTKISLDKAVSDAEIALDRAKIDYEKTVADSEKQLEKARRDTEKASVSATGSDAQASLAKAQLDYENLKASNAKTIENFGPSYRVMLSDLKKLVSSAMFDSDKLLGITEQNRAYNDSFEAYLGARDASILPRAQAAYAKAYEVSRFLDSKMDETVTSENVVSKLSDLSGQYAIVRGLLDADVRLLENSIPATTLTQSSIDAQIATYNGYKASLSGLENAFVSFKNSATSFLSNYQNNEASALAGIEIQKKNLATGEYDAKIGFERAKIAINAGIETAALAVRTAELNLDNATKNRETTLRKLEVSRSDAELQLKQANTELSKLQIVSPIDATVVKVIAQVGQDVSAGTSVVEISSRNPEVLIDVDADTASLLKQGATVEVSAEGKSYTGTVVGASKVANSALLYSIRIVLSDSPDLLGGAATVKISLPNPYPVVPVDMVKILSEQSGEMTVFSGGTFASVPVKIGRLSGGMAEIVSGPSADADVVITDVSNFDAKTAEPKRK
ncbi:MAG: biotin/lipoyl-binding protein [Patescibacteria group bacterium]